MADYLDTLRIKLQAISDLLSQVNTKLGRVSGESVRFNPRAGQWSGQVPGGPTGYSFLPQQAIAPANQMAKGVVEQGLKDATIIIRELGRQAGMTGQDLKPLFDRLAQFSNLDMAGPMHDWITDARGFKTELAGIIRELNHAIELKKQVRATGVSGAGAGGRGQPPQPPGVIIPPSPPTPPGGNGWPFNEQSVRSSSEIRANTEQQRLALQYITDLDRKDAEELSRKSVSQRKITELTEQQVAVARTLPRFGQAFNIIDQQARSLGLDPAKAKITASTEATTGYTRFAADLGTVDGVAQKVTLTVDKMGNAAVDTQRRFRSFGDAVRRDMVEFLKWTIAAAAIWGTFQKLQQVTQLMIANQSKLADITIVLGKAQSDTNEIFQSAADIANTTGTAIGGVLEGYNLAYRATGNLGSQTEKTTTANKLMADSLILSSLSGMSQAEALDTLVASLKQTNRSLMDGTSLMDKWVKTTRVANVDLNTLATGFAVVGDAAEAAGLDVDQLNGLIATIAETGISSGRETANAARAIISGFQSDTARKALENLGIALEDTAGQARSFIDLMQQLSDLRRSGVISDTEFSKLTLALGGGTRRQAVYSTFIENFGRVGEIAKESMSASGEASEALSIKLNTVEKSVIRLNNAFQSLAQGLGTQNGALSVINALVKTLTELVKISGDFGKVAGSSLIPALASIVAVWATAGKNNWMTQMGTKFATPFTNYFTSSRAIEASQMRNTGNLQQNLAAGQLMGRNVAGIAGGTLLAGVLPTVIEALNTGKVDVTKTGVRIGGAVVGGIIGAATPLGPVIGSAIGSVAGEALVNTFRDSKTELRDIWADIILPPEAGGAARTPEQRTRIEDQLSKEIEKVLQPSFAEQFAYKVLPPQLRGTMNKIGNEDWQKLYGNITPQQGIEALRPVYGEEWYNKQVPNVQMGGQLTPAQTMIARALRAQQQFGEELPTTILTLIENLKPENVKAAELTTSQSEFRDKYAEFITQTITDMNEEITQKLASGDIGKAAATQALGALGGFGTRVAQWGVLLRDQFINMGEKQFISMLANIAAYAPEDIKAQISQFVQNAQTYQAYAKIAQTFAPPKIAEFIQQKATQQAGYAKDLTEYAYRQNLISTPAMQQLDISKYSVPDLDKFLEYMKMQYKGVLTTEANANPTDQYTTERVDALMETTASFMIKTDQGFVVRELPASITSLWSDLLSNAEEQTELLKSQGIGFSPMSGVTTAQYNQALSQYPAVLQQLVDLGYKPEEEPSIIKLEDSQFFADRKDWKIMQYLLSQIADNTKKQLEGIYNLPEGASFWFPHTAIPYMQNAAGGGNLTPDNLPNLIASGIKMAGSAGPGLGRSWVDNKPQEILNPIIENIFKKYGPFPEEPPLGEAPAGSWLDQLLKPVGPPSKDKAIPQGALLGAGAGLPPIGPEQGALGGMGGILGGIKLPTLNTKIELTSQIQLIADGRTLASIVAPWLGEFLQDFTGTGDSTGISSVI